MTPSMFDLGNEFGFVSMPNYFRILNINSMIHFL